MKKKTILLLTGLMTLSACSVLPMPGKKPSKEEKPKDEEVVEVSDEKPNTTEHVIEESKRVNPEPLEPYYKGQLSKRSLAVYDQVVTAIEQSEKDIILKDTISTDDAIQLMSVLYFEETQLFHLSNKFGYTSDDSGSVSSLHVDYIMENEDYKKDLEKLEQFIGKVKRSQSQLEAQEEIFGKIPTRDNTNSTSDPLSNNPMLIMKTSEGEPSSLAYARLYQYMMRKRGVNATIKAGQITSPELNDIANLVETVDKDVFYEAKKDVKGSYTSVELDVKGLYFWNMTELNDEWYNIDVLAQKKIDKNKIVDSDSFVMKSLVNVPDTTISMSRLMYVANEMIGTAPTARANLFQHTYRSGNYVTNKQMKNHKVVIKSILDKTVEEKMPHLVIQFEDQEAYDIFKANIIEALELHSLNNDKSFKTYELKPYDSLLTYVIYDISYKG